MLTADQMAELNRLKAYFPFRIVFGAVSPSGEFQAGAVATMRVPNKLAREGWTVYRIN